jgi:hypothetical protein
VEICCTEIARLAGSNHVVKRAECLLERRFLVEYMDLVEVDVVGAESLQALIDFGQDRFS